MLDIYIEKAIDNFEQMTVCDLLFSSWNSINAFCCEKTVIAFLVILMHLQRHHRRSTVREK